MHYDRLGTEFRFDHLTGTAPQRCAFVGYRREPLTVVNPFRMESWVVLPGDSVAAGGQRAVSLELGRRGHISGLWHGPSGDLYATELHGRVHVRRTDQESGTRTWQLQDWGPSVELHGVWGLDEQTVFVWGRDAHQYRLWCLFEGRFVAMPAPRTPITVLRGCSQRCLYAAGSGGSLFRWDGIGWRSVAIRSMRPATGLVVVNEDEIWLTTDMGKLFEGTSHGWAQRAQVKGPLCDVMRWRGRLLLAGAEQGLLELVGLGHRILPVATRYPVIGLAGDDSLLLALTEDCLLASIDGQEFSEECREVVQAQRGGKQPFWDAGA